MPGDYLTAYSIDHHTGKLTLISKVGAKGDRANQVVLDPSGKFAGTVTYNSGTFSLFGVEPDGKLTEAFYTDQHAAAVERTPAWSARTRQFFQKTAAPSTLPSSDSIACTPIASILPNVRLRRPILRL